LAFGFHEFIEVAPTDTNEFLGGFERTQPACGHVPFKETGRASEYRCRLFLCQDFVVITHLFL
jgi:hypothetical protein